MSKEQQTVLALEAGGLASMSAMHQLRGSGLPLRLLGADMDLNSVACGLADEFYSVLPASNPDYATEVASMIEAHEVDVVLPSFHFGLKAMSELDSPAFVNDFAAGLICQDKWEFYMWCLGRNYKVPKTARLDTGEVPSDSLIAKPRHGAGARGNLLLKASELSAMRSYLQARDDYLIQEFVEGEQWVVDAMRLDGQFIGCVTARVETHRAGSALAVEVLENPELAELTRYVLQDLDYQGPANIDAIKDAEGNYNLLEVNPRFGGTIRFSYAAGVNWPAFLLSGEERFVDKPTLGRYSIMGEVVKLS